MRKSNTLLCLVIASTVQLGAQIKPTFKEIEAHDFMPMNLLHFETFIDWLTSPIVQHFFLFIILISLLYCTMSILIFVLVTFDGISSKEIAYLWQVLEIPKPRLKILDSHFASIKDKFKKSLEGLGQQPTGQQADKVLLP